MLRERIFFTYILVYIPLYLYTYIMKKKTSVMLEEEVWTEFRKLCLDEKKEAGIYLEDLIRKELSKKGKNK